MDSKIIDCRSCGARYMREVIALDAPEKGEHRCPCGDVLGEWDGPLRLVFDPEDQTMH